LGAYALAAVALFSFVLLVFLYRRNEKQELHRLQQTKADITDMMILFNTMRDIISQQKTLARDFNRELEKKMSLVKQVLARGMEKNERLYERQQALARELDEAGAQLQSLQRQIGYIQESAAKGAEHGVVREEPLAEAEPVEPYATPRVRAGTAPSPPPIEEKSEEDPLEGTGFTDAVFEQWAAQDFATPVPEPEEAPEITPESPEDPRAAREAFRALLSLEDRVPGGAPAPRPSAGGNGGRDMGPVQQRVLEYHEAGMTVADIARELGIGKGEIRLMLSLAKQSKP